MSEPTSTTSSRTAEATDRSSRTGTAATRPRGFATQNIWADDVDAATAWYSELLGIEPYFIRPPEPAPAAYVEFRVGDYQHELGIIDRSYAPPSASAEQGGVIMHWHVDDLDATYARLLAMGATEYEPPTERGPGFVTASVVDPFGNVFGIMDNAHYLEILASGGES